MCIGWTRVFLSVVSVFLKASMVYSLLLVCLMQLGARADGDLKLVLVCQPTVVICHWRVPLVSVSQSLSGPMFAPSVHTYTWKYVFLS